MIVKLLIGLLGFFVAAAQAETIEPKKYIDCLTGLKKASETWLSGFDENRIYEYRYRTADFEPPFWVDAPDFQRLLFVPATQNGKMSIVVTDQGAFAFPYDQAHLNKSFENKQWYYIVELPHPNTPNSIAIQVFDNYLFQHAEQEFDKNSDYLNQPVGSTSWYERAKMPAEFIENESIIQPSMTPANEEQARPAFERIEKHLAKLVRAALGGVFIQLQFATSNKKLFEKNLKSLNKTLIDLQRQYDDLVKEDQSNKTRIKELASVDLNRFSSVIADILKEDLARFNQRQTQMPSLLEKQAIDLKAFNASANFYATYLNNKLPSLISEILISRTAAQKITIEALSENCAQIPALKDQIAIAIADLQDPVKAFDGMIYKTQLNAFESN